MTSSAYPSTVVQAAPPHVPLTLEPSIFILGPDEATTSRLSAYLADQGMKVVATASWDEAAATMLSQSDVVLVISSRPDRRLTDLVRAERSRGSDTAFILLSDIDDVVERVLALEMGFDDLVAETCAPRELLVRIHRLLWFRKSLEAATSAPTSAERSTGAWLLNERTRTLTSPSGVSCSLSPQNIHLLNAFVERAHRGLDPTIDLAEGGSSFLRTAVCRLNRRIAKAGCAQLPIRSVRGKGYVLCAEVERTGWPQH